MTKISIASEKLLITVTMVAFSGALLSCSSATPYTDQPGLSILQDVHVRSLRAVKDGVWFVDATGRNAALTVGFVGNDGKVRRTSFKLKDATLLPNEPPGAGVSIQPASNTAAYITLSAAYPEPHEVALATVHLDGVEPSLTVEKGVKDLGTLTPVNGRVFAGESRPALMELKNGKIVDHWLPNDPNAPKNTLIAVADGKGDVVFGDGQSSRIGLFTVSSGGWTFTKVPGVSNFSNIAFSDDGAMWLLSGRGRCITKTSLGTGAHRTFDLAPSTGQGLAVLTGDVVCTGSSNDENVVTCVSGRGTMTHAKVALAYPPSVVAAEGSRLWYGLADLRAPASSFGNPDWGSAVGKIEIKPDLAFAR